ncbi:MAG: alginate export family protein [Bacteroidetes bacterium]|nr:alginate export family protein [Bacteroidota bacterium]
MEKTFLKFITTCVFIGLSAVAVHAQSTDDLLNLLIGKNLLKQEEADSIRAETALKTQETPFDKTLSIDLEWRPRTEFRSGYQQMANDTTVPALFTNQRTRLTFGYDVVGKYNFQFSIQDIHTFGANDPRSTAGTIQIFEAYFEPMITKNFSIRIGRQRLMYDNQRLFAQNDWRQNANAHDALNFRWRNSNLKTELAAAWNQTNEGVAGTNFTPTDASGKLISNYKLLLVHYLNWKFTKALTLTTINSGDGYQDAKNPEKLLMRYTNGGRVEFEKGNLYITMSGYYQHGHNTSNRKIDAFYMQPEIKYTLKSNTIFRLGMEYMSGNDATNKTDTVDHSFVPLYGVAHRFNGYMDLYTRFPSDLNNAGLINPYFFIVQNLSKKTSLGFYFHQFYSQNKFVNSKKEVIDNNLGFEHDILFNYKPNPIINLEIGYSYYLPTASTVLIKKAKVDSEKTFQQWAYVMLTVKPQILKMKFNK